MPKFFTNYDRPASPGFHTSIPSKTFQQFREECDINLLIARYTKTGCFYDPLAKVNPNRTPQFGDFTELGDFAEQQNRILAVYEGFKSLPSAIREKFGHNPAAFVEFVGNPANEAKCIEMGIFEKPVEKPVEQPIAPPPANPVVNPDSVQ